MFTKTAQERQRYYSKIREFAERVAELSDDSRDQELRKLLKFAEGLPLPRMSNDEGESKAAPQISREPQSALAK